MATVQFTGISSGEKEGVALVYFDILDYNGENYQWKDYVDSSNDMSVQAYLNGRVSIYTAQIDELLVDFTAKNGKISITNFDGQIVEIDVPVKDWVVPSPVAPPSLTERIKTLEDTIVELNSQIEALQNP